MITTFTGATPDALASIAEEKLLRKTDSVVLLFDMGSQFIHLIFQQVSKLGVYCLVADPSKVTADDVLAVKPQGIIVSGGPASVHAEPPPFDYRIFELRIPVLGVCLGAQMIAKALDIPVRAGEKYEFSVERLQVKYVLGIIDSSMNQTLVQQSHGDVIVADKSTQQLTILASTTHSPVAAFKIAALALYGVQFHPEVSETEMGTQIFENFCGRICGIADRFPATDVSVEKIKSLREQVGNKRVLLALSGGSDSSIVAHLLKKAMPSFDSRRLKGIYIKGIDRPDDEANVLKFFGNQPWIELEIVDATEMFLLALTRIVKSKEKRLAMRGVYKSILEQKIAEFGADFIAQGTLYTDLVESGHGHATGARRAQIKLHHNTNLGFSVPEIMPLSDCVKDNARDIGRKIGVPEELLTRQPFPGPGMLVRLEGEITSEKLRIGRAADGIMTEELKASGHYEKIWQSGVRVTISEHTKTAGDDAGVGCVIMWFAVSSVNGFTARAYDVPFEVRQKISDRMGNEIRGVGAVAYRDSGKPYSTIEAE